VEHKSAKWRNKQVGEGARNIESPFNNKIPKHMKK
jgi:hypothetical protein